MARPGHVSCATDLRETSPAAVELAGRLAQQRGARLHLLHVVANPFHQPWLTGTAGIDYPELLRVRIDNAERELKTLAGKLPPTAPGPLSSVMIGRPADEIVRHALDYDADLIVIGTHGYDGMQRVLLGRVADRVIRQAACPVLIVPSRSLEGAPTPVGTAGHKTPDRSKRGRL
jgi:universal stress protein A